MTGLELLVADDSVAAGAALANAAASLGWTTDLVESGEAALTQALSRLDGQGFYDALLLDWKMPGQDGLTTAREIREALQGRLGTRCRPLIIILVTAYSRDELLAQPGIALVDTVLSKPVTPSTLYNAIVGELSRRTPGLIAAQPAPTVSPGWRIPGVRVLLVDDSDINREVAQGILEADGAIVQLAGDGQEAVDWLRSHPDAVDVVLMDVQMPGLNGYEATRLIRGEARWRDLPIVALTAGAFQDLREAALASGMNDFIAKPFNVEQMMELIVHWTGCQPQLGARPIAMARDGGASRPEAQTGPFPPTLPGIDLTEGFKQWGKMDAYRIYLDKFIEDYANAGGTIVAIWRRGDNAAAAALVHKLTGVAGTLALPRVARLARQLDARLKKGESIVELGVDLQRAIDQVCASIAGWARSDRPACVSLGVDTTREPLALEQLFDQLLQALGDNDPRGAECVLGQLQGLVDAATLAAIQSELTDFDFRRAEVLTHGLVRDFRLSVQE